jgi:hypothetical protein
MFLFVLMWLISNTSCGPNSDNSKLREVQRIQGTLPVFPSSVQTSESNDSKAELAGATRCYKSDASYEELKRFYNQQLRDLGWAYESERGLKDWGRDLGGRELTFRNNDYRVHIQFAGKDANYGWDYAISVSWGE